MGAALKDLILNILQTSEEKRYDISKLRNHFFYSVSRYKQKTNWLDIDNGSLHGLFTPSISGDFDISNIESCPNAEEIKALQENRAAMHGHVLLKSKVSTSIKFEGF